MILLLLLERVLMRNQLNRSERDFVVIDHLVVPQIIVGIQLRLVAILIGKAEL